jgi:hypothetical protein
MRVSAARITHRYVMPAIDSRLGNSEPSPSKLLIFLLNSRQHKNVRCSGLKL